MDRVFCRRKTRADKKVVWSEKKEMALLKDAIMNIIGKREEDATCRKNISRK